MNVNAFERHAQTALTSLVVLLLAGVVAFIFKIHDAQTEQLIEIRQLQYQIKGVADGQIGGRSYMEREINRIDNSISNIWPRLRALGENQEILLRHLQALHPTAKIKLNEPERF